MPDTNTLKQMCSGNDAIAQIIGGFPIEQVDDGDSIDDTRLNLCTYLESILL